MIYPPMQKPPIWGIDKSIISYNCMRYGFRVPSLYLPMWERAGRSIVDLSNKQHMIFGAGVNSPAWNGGIKFSDAVQYLAITNPSKIIFPDISFSIVIRFKCSQNGENQYIINKNYGGVGVKWWGVQINSFGSFSVMIDDGATFKSNTGDSVNLDNGLWHTCVGIRNVEKGILDVYVDGKKDVESQVDILGTVDSGTGDFWIGCRTDGDADRDFAGDVDFVKIFPYALSVRQVAFDFANPYFMLQIPEELYGCSFFI